MKEFLLGVLVAVALYLIWRKELGLIAAAPGVNVTAVSSPCSGCAKSAPTYGAAPAPQATAARISPTSVGPIPPAVGGGDTGITGYRNVPGGAQVTIAPIRSTYTLPSFDEQGFVQHYRSVATNVN